MRVGGFGYVGSSMLARRGLSSLTHSQWGAQHRLDSEPALASLSPVPMHNVARAKTPVEDRAQPSRPRVRKSVAATPTHPPRAKGKSRGHPPAAVWGAMGG